jgi:protein-L-isoaspartate(D-aspartate) O-methyltransferase
MGNGVDELRIALAERLRDIGRVDPAVIEAFATVPRHVFLPGIDPTIAYRDDAIVTKRDATGQPISSSSQPAIMAIMLDQLGLRPGLRVLEIGAGTGYNAALMSHLVEPSGSVTALDIDADLVAAARANLDRAGYPDVTVVCADGAEGYPAGAPYDRVIATVGVWDLAPAWLDHLNPDGRIVVPVDLAGVQRSVAFERAADHWTSRSVVTCGFMRLRGGLTGPERTEVLDRAAGLTIALPSGGDLDPAAVLDALDAGPTVRRPTGVRTTPAQLLGNLGLWLAIRQPDWCMLTEAVAAHPARLIEPPVDIQEYRTTIGIHHGRGGAASLALLAGRSGAELSAYGYGPDGDRLAAELVAHVCSWDAAGRPGNAGLRIDAYPVDPARPGAGPVAVAPDAAVVIAKRYTRLELNWDGA